MPAWPVSGEIQSRLGELGPRGCLWELPREPGLGLAQEGVL